MDEYSIKPKPERPQVIPIGLIEQPPIGRSQLITRTIPDDRNDICLAARALGMTQSDYTRLILVAASRRILAHYGVALSGTQRPSTKDTSQTPTAG